MDDEKYIPTEEEKRRFGNLKAGRSILPKSTKNIYDMKKFLRDFGNLADKMSSTISKKKFLSLWYDCWKIDTVEKAIEYIRNNLQKFNDQDSNKIEKRLEEIERFVHAI